MLESDLLLYKHWLRGVQSELLLLRHCREKELLLLEDLPLEELLTGLQVGLLVLQIGLMRLRGSGHAVHIYVNLQLLAVLSTPLLHLSIALGSTPFPLEFVSLPLFFPRGLMLIIAFIRGVPFR